MPTQQQLELAKQVPRGSAGYYELLRQGYTPGQIGTGIAPVTDYTPTAEDLAAERIANNPNAPPTDPYQTQLESAYGGVSNILTNPAEEEARIREEARRNMQAYIDAINREYAEIIAREEKAGVGRLGMTRAITAQSGTLGSGFGEQAMETTREGTRKIIAAYEAEKGTKIAKANADIVQMANDEIKAKKAEALGYLGELEKVRTANRDKAIETAKLLTPSDLESLSEDKYKALLSATGWDATTLERVAAANAKSEITNFKTEIQGKQLITTWWDKTTGKPTIQVEDLSKYGVTGDQYDRSSFDEKTGQLLLWNEKTGESKVVKPEGYKPSPSTTEGPTSYQEWQLAGGLKGTGKSYADWLKKSSAVSISAENKTKLLGAGFTNADIDSIESDVNEYGLDSVLEGISNETQKKAIQDVYGKETSKLTRESLSKLYGIPDNDAKTGFWSGLGFGKTNREKLDALMKIVEQYQAVGMSDADIIKKMEGK